MSEQAKKLVPERRFSEFRSAEEWELSQFSEVYNLHTTNSYSRDMLNYKNGSVKNIHYGDIHTKFQTLFDITKETVPFINPSESLEKIKPESYCVEGDIVFADASEDLADVGKSIEIVNLNNEPLLSGLHTLLARQKDNKLVIGFGGHLFKSAGIRKQIQKESQGAKVLGISGGRLSGIKVYYPSDKQEQQKIADCLSSLDDLINAQNKKVEALKQHKKGLMQQLFPAEGETVPKLRFPEFSQLWIRTPLGMLCSSISSGRDQLDIDGRYELYGSTSIIGKTTNPSFQGERILVARVGANAGFLTKANGVFGVTDNTLVISLNSSINIDFLYYYLGNVNINKLIFGSGQPLITGSILKALDIPVPIDSEQKKISDCLLSLDGIIAGQNSKLESLMTLKKGLMQQLFPVLERVEVWVPRLLKI